MRARSGRGSDFHLSPKDRKSSLLIGGSCDLPKSSGEPAEVPGRRRFQVVVPFRRYHERGSRSEKETWKQVPSQLFPRGMASGRALESASRPQRLNTHRTMSLEAGVKMEEATAARERAPRKHSELGEAAVAPPETNGTHTARDEDGEGHEPSRKRIKKDESVPQEPTGASDRSPRGRQSPSVKAEVGGGTVCRPKEEEDLGIVPAPSSAAKRTPEGDSDPFGGRSSLHLGMRLIECFSTTTGRGVLQVGDAATVHAEDAKIGNRVRFRVRGREVGRLTGEDAPVLVNLLRGGFLRLEACVVDCPDDRLRINSTVVLHVDFHLLTAFFAPPLTEVAQQDLVHFLKRYDWMQKKEEDADDDPVRKSLLTSTKVLLSDEDRAVAEDIPRLRSTLRQYQKLGVSWMVAKERLRSVQTNVRNPFWEELEIDGVSLFCNSVSGAVSLENEKVSKACRGGILADEMGLGKTVQTIGTILANPPDPETTEGGTLVVAPMSVLSQWEDEIAVHADGLRVVKYYGFVRGSLVHRDLHHASHDVIVTTYGVVASEFRDKGHRAPLHRLRWHRVVLDEAQAIKNRSTGTAKAVFELQAVNRWALTGTPIQNHVEDLYAILRFLDLDPWRDYRFWQQNVGNNYKSGSASLMAKAEQLIRLILEPLLLRRRKDSSDENGTPILKLTSLDTQIVELLPSAEEKDVYDMLYLRTKTRFDTFVAQGNVLSNLANVLVLLLRLRQCCDHPFLVIAAPSKDLDKMDDLEKLAKRFLDSDRDGEDSQNPAAYVGNIVSELKSGSLLSNSECPICLELMEDGVFSICAHAACRACFLSCFQGREKTLCPVCRKDIRRSDLVTIPRSSRFPIDLEKKWKPSRKVEQLIHDLEAIRSQGTKEKSIVFSQFTSFLDLLEVPLKRHGFAFLRLDGSTSQQNRASCLAQFAQDDVPVILMSLKAGGVGLNLTMANHVFLMDPWWNPAVEDQAIGRVHRMGQKRPVFVRRYIMEGTVEQKLVEIQEKKRFVAEGALEENTEQARKQRLDDIMYLFS